MTLLKQYWALATSLLFGLLYLIPLNGRALWQPDETRYAEISREMLERSDWLVPHLLGVRYFEKPVAGYWFNNISQWIFGDNNFAVRFGSVFSTALAAVLVFTLAMLMWRNRRTAMLAALIFLSMLLVFGVGTYSVLDPMVSLWLVAAMASYYLSVRACGIRGRVAAFLLLGLACGMGFMTKGFLALAVPVIAVLPAAILQGRFRQLLIYGPLAVMSALMISLPWIVSIHRLEPDYWHYFFWVEHIQRFADEDAQHKQPFWYYLPVLLLGCMPWLALLPGALWSGWRNRRHAPELLYLLCWVVMPLLFFSVAKGKLLTYILPCMAPLALLMAAYAQRCQAVGHWRVFRTNAVINVAFGLICLAALIVLNTGMVKDVVEVRGATFAAGAASFVGWVLFGLIAWREKSRCWTWAAACPVALSLLVGQAIPQQVIDSKQPQFFIADHREMLSQSHQVLSNSVGVATALAWELKRTDVLMYRQTGELQYGLSYPDARGRFISDSEFMPWLAEARKKGNVSLVLLLARDQRIPCDLRAADKIYWNYRSVLVWYRQLP